MPAQPLAEVFGFPISNQSEDARRSRQYRLCPYNNKVPNCTKDSALDPLGVCSIFDGDEATITCPTRFRQGWKIITDTAERLFPGQRVLALPETPLPDKNGKAVGNIDVLLVAHDETGTILDFGALEVQSVYISGNVGDAFREFMADHQNGSDMVWDREFPRADYLSSSRKRLIPQLMSKGRILSSWNKKMVVAIQQGFFATLPVLPSVTTGEADVMWHIYSMSHDPMQDQYSLSLEETVFTKLEAAVECITATEPGEVADFVKKIQAQVNKRLGIRGRKPRADHLPSDLLEDIEVPE